MKVRTDIKAGSLVQNATQQADDIFKKIKKQLEADSPESEYIGGLIASLDSAKVKGIEDSKMKEIIDFLSSASAPEKEEKKST